MTDKSDFTVCSELMALTANSFATCFPTMHDRQKRLHGVLRADGAHSFVVHLVKTHGEFSDCAVFPASCTAEKRHVCPRFAECPLGWHTMKVVAMPCVN
jgi:hypothetical protein